VPHAKIIFKSLVAPMTAFSKPVSQLEILRLIKLSENVVNDFKPIPPVPS
jgi:hypothetical protein